MQQLPTYAAPDGGRLSAAMLRDYADVGVLVLENFVPVSECHRLRKRALELVATCDASELRHVFSAMKQTQIGDRYF